jgi:hypothetical protein
VVCNRLWLAVQQLRALLAKRMLSAMRDRLALVTQLLVPLLLVYLALWVGNASVGGSSGLQSSSSLLLRDCTL